jgi:putative ABC transport system permease protein
MNLLNRLTLKNLRLNKKRTLVTIIGIILSTALITGVATLVSSFRSTIIEYEKQDSGDYHYVFYNVPADDLKYIKNNRNVEDVYLNEDLGYSLLDGSKNEDKPYLYLKAYSKGSIEKLGIELKEGRLPENDNEVVISSHIKSNGGVEYKIGDELDLKLGERISDGESLDQGKALDEERSESFVLRNEKNYKIVGIIERPNFDIEPYTAPGYTVLTILNENDIKGSLNVYVRYKDVKKHLATTAQIIGIDEQVLKRISDPSNGMISESDTEILGNAKYVFSKNDSLIRWENLELKEATRNVLYTVSAIVIVIIIVTSVFCIRNSFEISITEKTRQYGMLASVGATSKQIRKNVLYEGLILGLIGVPVGILSGLIAIFVLLKVISHILKSFLGFEFIFTTNLLAIAISILLAGITIYLSARKSAKRASKISPIEAIRNTDDIKIKAKKLRTPRIIKSLFGVGGDISYKNLKRNRKKYRTTVISIIVSVSIFIAMSAFIEYAFGTTSVYYKDYDYNLIVNGRTSEINQLLEIVKNDTVKKYSINRNLVAEVAGRELRNHYTSEKKNADESLGMINSNDEKDYANLVAVGKDEYMRFLSKNGLKYDDVKDKVILNDSAKTYIDSKKAYSMYRIYDYKKGDHISASINGKSTDLEIAAIVDSVPMGPYYSNGMFIVSDEFFDKYKSKEDMSVSLYMDSSNPNELEEIVRKSNIGSYVENIETIAKEQNAMMLAISIFLYGFIAVISLIGVTNIFNTITTNMELRQKEFANLKSIGMTKKEFNRMIRLESVLYGGKTLVIGIPIGVGLSYLLFKAFGISYEMTYELPFKAIGISIVVVAILIWVVMRFSLKKINKQNIIETIRKDNI